MPTQPVADLRPSEAGSRSQLPRVIESIRFQHPELPDSADVERYLTLARDARWFSNGGPCHRLLRDRLEQFLEHRCHVVLTANGTLGLLLALRALLGEHPAGSLVIVPSFTFPATVEAIRWCGLQPLWVDVERSGWHLDPQALSDALANRQGEVAAVLACSTFGTAPSTSQAATWRELCSQARIPLIVDSAPGFGSRDEDGGPLGTQGDAEVFSFHATKPFAIGEGGAVTTSDPTLAERLTALTNFGFGSGRIVGDALGLNAKLSEIHAAIGLAVLDRFDAILTARRTRAERMRSELEPAGYRFQAGSRSSAWQFVPVLAPSPEMRDAVLAGARRQAIEIRTYHPPLHRMPVFASHPSHGELAATNELAERSLSLPLANDLSDDEVGLIEIAARLDSGLLKQQHQQILLQSAIHELQQSGRVLELVYEEESDNVRALGQLRRSSEYEQAFTDPQPLVSVIIPTYRQHELLVTRAIPSALEQTYPHVEVVVVGDGSPPQTAAAIETLNDPRVRYTNLTVRAPYPEDATEFWRVAGTPPWNTAWQLARGRWIAPLNDDDAFRPDHVERLLATAREQRCEVAYGAIEHHQPDGSTEVVNSWPPESHRFGWQAALIHAGLSFMPMQLGSGTLGVPGDWSLCRRMRRAGVSFAKIDEVVVDYFPSQLWNREQTTSSA